jgi:hypothetical protein
LIFFNNLIKIQNYKATIDCGLRFRGNQTLKPKMYSYSSIELAPKKMESETISENLLKNRLGSNTRHGKATKSIAQRIPKHRKSFDAEILEQGVENQSNLMSIKIL